MQRNSRNSKDSRNSRVGTDLEYAVKHNGAYVPAGFLPIEGTKGNPTILENGGVEIDCCAVEITPFPARSAEQFATNILSLLNEVKKRYSEVSLETVASIRFKQELLDAIPQANTMGCDPDFNAWTGRKNPRPAPKHGLRSFGGHVHIEDGTKQTIRACDMTLGMWSVLNDPDKERRKLYGKAGAFRPKPYGVEYRTLSNHWCDNEASIRKVFKLVRLAQDIEGDAEKLSKKFGGPDVIQRTINSSDVVGAKRFLKYFGISHGISHEVAHGVAHGVR